uniref:Uncharacterized protein n=1 Tax=Opuntia streptacantha TaxID=393608 RepID=A0A7C9DNH3_OPUST
MYLLGPFSHTITIPTPLLVLKYFSQNPKATTTTTAMNPTMYDPSVTTRLDDDPRSWAPMDPELMKAACDGNVEFLKKRQCVFQTPGLLAVADLAVHTHPR